MNTTYQQPRQKQNPNDNGQKMQEDQLVYQAFDTPVSAQIAVYKTNKALIEILDKLTPAEPVNYAHIHGNDKKSDGSRSYSLLGLVLLDYSAGTGDNAIRVSANISPEDLAYLLTLLNQGQQEVDFRQEKIFGTMENEPERGLVTRVCFRRSQTNQSGQALKYPWRVEVQNGTGIKAKAATGGTYLQANSYQMEKKVAINLNDQDLFKLLYKTMRYVAIWEMTCGSQLFKYAQQIKQQQQNLNN